VHDLLPFGGCHPGSLLEDAPCTNPQALVPLPALIKPPSPRVGSCISLPIHATSWVQVGVVFLAISSIAPISSCIHHLVKRQGESLNHQGVAQSKLNKQLKYAIKNFKNPNLIPRAHGGFAHLATCKLFL